MWPSNFYQQRTLYQCILSFCNDFPFPSKKLSSIHCVETCPFRRSATICFTVSIITLFWTNLSIFVSCYIPQHPINAVTSLSCPCKFLCHVIPKMTKMLLHKNE
jgi:hypothetical protein